MTPGIWYVKTLVALKNIIFLDGVCLIYVFFFNHYPQTFKFSKKMGILCCKNYFHVIEANGDDNLP